MTTFSKILPISLASFAVIGCAPALADTQPLVASAAESTAAPASKLPALWKIADEDTTIYVFGTIHVLPDDVDWYSGKVKTALNESSALVTEIDNSPEADAEVQQALGALGVYRDGTNLRSLMNEEQTATYEAALTSLGQPVTSYDSLKPWLASLLMTLEAFKKAGITGENGTEDVLEAKFGEDKQRVALETPAFQFGIFDSMPVEAQMNQLIEGAAEVDNLADALSAIIDEWAVGDVEGVAALMNEVLENDPAFAKALLYDRNQTWANWIDNRLEEPGTVFMAVGAGHLAGDKSVQEYLTTLGIQTVRIQ